LRRAFDARDGVHLSDGTTWTWFRDDGLVWGRPQSRAAVKTYLGEDCVRRERRATFQPDYGRRGPRVHRAPRLHESHPAPGARARGVPSERWLLIEDNLSADHSRDTRAALVGWPQVTL
jgi:hypothetical protein